MISLLIACVMVEKTDFEIGCFSQPLDICDLNLDLALGMSCITHQPLPTYQISSNSKLERIFVKWTYGWTDRRILRPGQLLDS